MVFALVLLFAGVQGVFAMMDCDGTIYLKLPDGWRTAFAVGGGNFNQFKASRDHAGWYELSTSLAGGDHSVPGFNIVTADGDYGQKGAITPRGITEAGDQVSLQEASGFKCTQFGATGELWIEPDPANPSKIRYSGAPADVKYFRIMLPEDVKWKSAVPMIVEDNGSPVAMEADPDRCGWYFRRYVDQAPPATVAIYRDDDEQKKEGIGMDGDWGVAGQVREIPLNTMFEFLGSNEIFFVATEEFADQTNPDAVGWTDHDPGAVGACGYNLAAMIYDTDASLHGAFTCSHYEQQCDGNPDVCKNNACYYGSAPYNVVSSATAVVPCIGVTTGMVEDVLGKDKKPKLTTTGKACFGSDADNAFTAMFNPTPNVNEAYCFDMPFTQTDDGKYEFDSDGYQSPGATVPGGFYPAEETPTAFVEGSEHLPAAENKRLAEGPVFFCMNGQYGDGLREIDSKEGVPVIDLFCNGPNGAWDGGIDCNKGHLFANGGEFNATGFRAPNGVAFSGDGWGWSCDQEAPLGWRFYKAKTETFVATKSSKNANPEGGNFRWTSGDPDSEYGDVLKGKGRNQHFCFESHASFRYKKGLRFSFRGDDDIWVYIDNKLAVDLGGTHLAAPGYVDLDKFKGNSGGFTVGTEYDIDIFFCDRRTTMSNVRIKTNMFIKQTTGLGKDIVDRKNGVEVYALCYAVSSKGDCGGGTGERYCEDELIQYLNTKGKNIDYTLTDKKGTVIKTAAELAQATVYFGGLDLTNRADPKIDRNALNGLPPNDYILWASIDNSKEKFEFTIEGNIEVLNKPGVARDEDANEVANYEPVVSALASSEEYPIRVPIYVSSIMDRGDDAVIDLASAVEQAYGITVTNAQGLATGDVVLEYKDESGNFKVWTNSSKAGAERVIGQSGVDTIYASLSMAFMKEQKETYDFSVTGHAVKLSVTFFAPKLVFVESEVSTTPISGDPPDKELFVGPVYTFYVLALAPSMTNPDEYEECGERCNFPLALGSMTSAGITTTDSVLMLVNGRATVNIYSTKEYRVAGDGVADNPATLSITGPKADLINAIYTPLHFKKPPVPYPVFADIFDVHGKTSPVELNMKDPYFNMGQEYLDGIADSLVIYYNRPFYNSPDSMPNRIIVFWDGDKDSVIVEKDVYYPGNVVCGSAAGLDDTLCAPRISIGGVQFSKDIRTANPSANLKSYARYSDRGKVKEDPFPGVIKDRVAPVIKSADIRRKDDVNDMMTLTLSEPVLLLNPNFATTAFTVYLNSAANLKTPEQKYVVGVKSANAVMFAGDKITVFYSGNDDNPTPHTGDYLRFRADEVIWSDSSNIAILGDTARPSDDASYNWNSPTPYDATVRLPSAWTPVTGEAEVGVKAIKYTEISPDYVAGKSKDQIAITSVKSYPVTTSFDEVKADNPGKLGFFLKSDMNSLVYSDTNISKYFTDPANAEKVKQIFLEVEMDLFSNLGNFVAHDVVKIHCTDEDIYGVGHTCLDTQKNFFISWNLVSADKRLVGTGAYVSKMNSRVHMPRFGKKNKMEETQMWGVRRTKKANVQQAEIVNQ